MLRSVLDSPWDSKAFASAFHLFADCSAVAEIGAVVVDFVVVGAAVAEAAVVLQGDSDPLAPQKVWM